MKGRAEMSDYQKDNDVERARLLRVLNQVGSAEMLRMLPNGWTVAATLAHLAFWDRYAVGMLTEWGAKGFRPPATQVQQLNEAVAKMSHLISIEVLLEWVRTSAEDADKAAAEVSPELAAAIEAGGQGNYLRRSLHRHHHVVHLEAALGVM